MVTILFTNGHSAQIADATSVELDNQATSNQAPQIKFLDSAGKVVARFRADHVERYTIDSSL